MLSADLEVIKKKIASQHEGDATQLEIVFSDSPRILVEAPAGYGKTTTMISRIAYLFATDCIPNPKKLLGLTFSVNAALKVKREVASRLPSLIGMKNSPVIIKEKATITNYHGFCKGILKKYGYLLFPLLRKDVNLFRAIGDNEIKKQKCLIAALTADELRCIADVERTIKEARVPDVQTVRTYNGIISQKLLPLDYITYNAVILFVLELFSKHKEVRTFYQNYYSLIVVDEFQDTNSIAKELLDAIISDKTQLLFLGDSLQRIYGFIGALPELMNSVVEEYKMTKIVLSSNYRFRNNLEMLKLDKIIRTNSATCFVAHEIVAADVAKLPAFWGSSQQDEATQIASKVQTLISDGVSKTAILFRSRGRNSEIVEEELIKKQISFFYGMFTDEDADYIEFHNKCQEVFIQRFGKQKTVSKKALESFVDSIKTFYSTKQGKTFSSLMRLLDALVNRISIDYAELLPDDKYTLVLDIFENRQLKQAMEYVDSQVILSTVHGAKGLEWEYVFLCDVERFVFPGYHICNSCVNKDSIVSHCRCVLPRPLPDTFTNIMLDELSVFYVGLTRAKKQAFVSASASRPDGFGREKQTVFSCLVGLNGIKLIKAT